MPETSLDVLCIGNAIVDVIAEASDTFLRDEGLVKGTMRLIDAEEAERLYSHMAPAHQVSGGSAGNTAPGIAALGARSGFIGQVAPISSASSTAMTLELLASSSSRPPPTSAFRQPVQ